MSGPYNQTAHDALNGDSSHFDANPFYHSDPNSFTNMDPSLTTGVDNLDSAAAAASAHLSGGSPGAFNNLLVHGTSTNSGAGTQVEDSLMVTTPAKTGKASRACDECRRRKSKCTEGNPETGQACAPCRARSGPDAECHYNRTPMKRGPSKGYIQAMKGNVDDVSRGQLRVVSRVEDLEVELEVVKDQLSKLVDFISKKFGEDALEPVVSREEVAKRIRFSGTALPDTHVLTLDGQKALLRYQSHYQQVLPFLPTDPLVLQTIIEDASETVQTAFELALRAIDTPVYSGNVVNQARADFIEKANKGLEKQAYGPLHLATFGILMLAIQTTGPVTEYKGKFPNMLTIHDKAIGAFAALAPFEETSSRPTEISSYLRSIVLGIRSLLLITSVGSGEIFGIIDQIVSPSAADTHILSESAYRFAQLAETFHEILRSGLASIPINFEALSLYDANLPSADYKVVPLTLQLLTTRLNTFTDTPDWNEIILTLNNVIDSLYLFTLPENGTPYAPSCWLHYHGLALAVKTAFDLANSDEIDGDTSKQVAAAAEAVEKLKQTINQLPVGVLSGWEQAAMNTLSRFPKPKSESSSSSGRWRNCLLKDAYMRALDF